MWSSHTVFHPVGSKGAGAGSLPLAAPFQRFALVPLLICTSKPSGSFTWKLLKSPLWSATGFSPRFLSSASTLLVSQLAIPQQKLSQTPATGGRFPRPRPVALSVTGGAGGGGGG